MAKASNELVWDYVVFGIFLIGLTLYPLVMERRQKRANKTKQNYVFAIGRVSIMSIMLSIARGTQGVRSVLGYPSELFYRGSGMWETLYGLVTAYPIVCFLFVPVYFSLGITSVYQYLDMRFKSHLVRSIASGTFIIRNVFLLGVTVYTPTVALNTIVGIPYWVSILVMTIAGISFTIFGNLKSAITADVVQAIIMFIVCIVVIIVGTIESGGIDQVYIRNKENDRLQFFTFSGDITTRVDTLSAWLGNLFISLSLLGCQQNNVQRYMSMNSLPDVRRALLLNIPFVSILFSLSWFVGMVIYSTYYLCDPLKTGEINKMDEIFPYFIEKNLGHIPGFLGLFLASLFNGALCVSASSFNALATVTYEDFVSLIPLFKGITDRQQLFLIKTLGVLYGLMVMGIAFIVGLMPGVTESGFIISSVTTGPLVGVFVLALLIPFANWKGAAIGMISSHLLIITIVVGSFTLEHPAPVLLPTSIEGCTILNDTFLEDSTNSLLSRITLDPAQSESRSFIDSIFLMTYMYYSVVGVVTTIVIGSVVSLLTASDIDKYDVELIHPISYKISQLLPGKKLYKDPAIVP